MHGLRTPRETGVVLKIEEVDNIREEHNISLVEWMKKVFVYSSKA